VTDLEREIRALGPWFHNLELGGVQTAPEHFLGDYPRVNYRRFADALPADLRGKTVLDVGCNAGFYAFEMKRRGAARVVAIDTDARYLAQARLAARVLGLAIELRELDVYRIAELRERFDLVIFMGVLYHLRHPLLALDLLHDHAVGGLLLFQSMQRGPDAVAPIARDYDFGETAIFERPAHPAMYFVEHRYAHDWTNWWIPNRACVEAMLRSAGFVVERHPEREVYLCRRAPRRANELTEVLP
jgi:tRNA (mo5U34)-methyltransferase